MERAYVNAAWNALPENRRDVLLHRDRVCIIRWIKSLLRERMPGLGDTQATITAARIATEMFGAQPPEQGSG